MEKLISCFYDIENTIRHTIDYNDVFHPAPTKMKKFRKGNNKKKKSLKRKKSLKKTFLY